MNHTRKVKKTCLVLYKVLKERVSRDNPKLVKANEELIKIAEEVIARGRQVKAQTGTIKEEPPQVKRLKRQLSEWLEITEKIVEQTKAVLGGHLHIPQRL